MPFVAPLAIGRGRFVEAAPLQERRTRRGEQVVVASRNVNRITHGRLYRDISLRSKFFAD